ncbi:serine/threonine-protein kinase [Dokdonella fugitiva]|uniref:Serine/threonine-protein kinase n=1 Tax=Dokdonella fugitiva TaxID=328517 RepID=A0A839F0U1_9GAMM|nr:serine/threonine-protein kinase [Dokdonella fugitiva]MBA8887509.1 serine/threonine-protein kinase [Dokdonella fugitiva]
MSPWPDAARWRALDAALRVLLELEADAQAAWLARHCATQPDLADELRRLLGHARRAGPLEALDAARLLDEALDAARPAAIEIGGWRLWQRIGAGGMAEVFLAERVHDSVRQVAAFKLMAVGFASPALRMRFLRERAILARLTDARIARYLDGGIAADGRPWLALEYVDGLPIDRYCMQHALDLRARVELFRDVAGAVAHAHRHLVVHRDIKPSNVLVSRDGQVKLLDFGIAKPLDEDGDVTQASARLLTPHYASPEQLRGEPASTATDVFLLGLLLYELACDERPFATYDGDRVALERALCECESPRPADVLERRRSAGHVTSVAPRALRGDFERIVSHALQKEPEQRYSSVDAFDRDLVAWFAGEPIAARAATWGERAGALVRRHRLVAAAVAGALVVSFAYAGALVAQNRQVRAQRDAARIEAAKAAATRDFLVELFEQADPAKSEGENLSVGKVLDAGSERIAGAFPSQPRVRADLLYTIGRVHHALGSHSRARSLLEQAIDLQRGFGGVSDDLARDLTELAAIERDDSHLDRAIERAREAVRAAGDGGGNAAALHGLGIALSMRDAGDYAEGVAVFDRAIAAYRRQQPPDPLALAEAQADRAGLYMHLGRVDEAEAALRASLAVMAPRLGDRAPGVTAVLYNLARLQEQRGDYAGAATDFARVIAAESTVFGADSVDVAIDRTRLAYAQSGQRRYERAAVSFAAALAVLRAKLPPDHKRIAENLMGYAEALVELDRVDEATRTIDEALRILARHFGDDDWRIAEARRVLARAWHASGRSDEARRLLQRAGAVLLQQPAPYPERYRATLAVVGAPH